MDFSVPNLTPAQWRERTSLRIGKRTAETLRLDAAYDLFYMHQRTRNAAHYALRFLKALDDYLVEKSEGTRNWDRVNRNKSNGGIMKIFAERLSADLEDDAGITTLAPPPPPPIMARVPLVTSSKSVSDAVKALEDVDIPNARMGVLFLLANLEVEVDLKGVILDGLGKMSVMAATLSTTQMSSMHSSVSSTGHVLESTSLGGGLTASPLIGGGGAAFAIGSAVKGSDGTDTQLPAFSTPGMGAHRPYFPTPGRLRSDGLGTGDLRLPSVMPTRPLPPPMPAHMVSGTYDPPAPPPPPPMSADQVRGTYDVERPTTLVRSGASRNLTRQEVEAAKTTLAQDLELLFNKVLHQIEKRFKLDPAQTAGLAAGPVKAIIAACIDTLVLSATPFLGSSLQIATGVARTTAAVCTKVASYLDHRKIRLMEGHPAQIASAIETQMNWNIGTGLKDLLRGGASLGAQLVTLGASSLVDVILNVVEFLVKALMRYMEIQMTRKFLEQARRAYELARSTTERVGEGTELARITPKGDRSSNIIFNTELFSGLFDLGCEASVVVPMLVLNSGIAGSLMTMIHMTRDNVAISEEEFAAGNRYLTRMKQLGRQYLQTAGWKFTGKNPFVQGVLGHAVHDHQAPTSALDIFIGIARG